MTADIKIPYPLPMMGGTRIKVELDKKALFALASDTRLEILKSLQSNRRTLSQLAEMVGVDKAAIHRHLKKLEEGGFVIRNEDHGFVYYGLTWKARDLMSPGENTRIVVLLSSSFISVMVILVLVFSMLSASFGMTAPMDEGAGQTDKSDPSSQFNFIPQVSPSSLLIFLPFLAVLAGLSFFAGWRKMRRPLHRGREEIDNLPPAAAD